MQLNFTTVTKQTLLVVRNLTNYRLVGRRLAQRRSVLLSAPRIDEEVIRNGTDNTAESRAFFLVEITQQAVGRCLKEMHPESKLLPALKALHLLHVNQLAKARVAEILDSTPRTIDRWVERDAVPHLVGPLLVDLGLLAGSPLPSTPPRDANLAESEASEVH